MRDAEKRNINGYDVIASVPFGGNEHILAEKETIDGDIRYMTCIGYQITEKSFSILEAGIESNDYLEVFKDFTSRLAGECENLQEHLYYSDISVLPLSMKDCIEGGLDKSIMKEVVILKASSLAPEWRTADNQVQIALDGLGCRPNSANNEVYCINIISGDKRRYLKDDIAGVADISRLPEMARNKIAELRVEQQQSFRDGTFEYGGLHFKPYRKFEKRDTLPNPKPHRYKERVVNMENMRSDRELGISKYDGRKADYSHESFYQASGGSTHDIFQCLENGKLYVPAENELFQYTEPKQKKKSKDSILDNIETNKDIVAQQKNKTSKKETQEH